MLDGTARHGFSRRERLIQELSPYRMLARSHESEMGAALSVDARFVAGGPSVRRARIGNYALRGVPAALPAQLVKWLRARRPARKRGRSDERISVPPRFDETPSPIPESR